MSKKRLYVSSEDAWMYIQAPKNMGHTATHYTRVPSIDSKYPSEDGWEDVIYLHEPILDPSGAIRKPEWIYVLVNVSMHGMVKVGMTTNTVEERAKEINAATGVPTPWIPVFKFKCYGSRYLEKEVHDYLQQYRVANNREMFSTDAMTAQKIIEKLGTNYANALYVATELKQDLENQN